MSEPKLLPCPFCGWEEINVLIDSMGRDDEGRPLRSIGAGACPKCGARGPRMPAHSTDQTQVERAWNRRADLGETVARAWAVANAAAREAAELRRAPTDAERADVRDVIAAHERANERMRQEARELTERLALVTKQRDDAEARAQAVAASTHGHSETPSGPRIGGWVRDRDGNVWKPVGRFACASGVERLWGYDAKGRVFEAVGVALRPCEAPKPAALERAAKAVIEAGSSGAECDLGVALGGLAAALDAPPPMRAPGERWWRIHRSAHRVELMIAEPPMDPRCIGTIARAIDNNGWAWRGACAIVDGVGTLRGMMRAVEVDSGAFGPLDEEVVP